MSDASATEPHVEALLAAAVNVAQKQPGRAAQLVPGLEQRARDRSVCSSWLAEALPRVLTATAVSLAGRATTPPSPAPEPDEKPAPALVPSPELAGELAEKVLAVLAGIALDELDASASTLGNLAEALEVSPGDAEAMAWVASKLAARMGLPREPSKLCRGVEAQGGSPNEARRLVVALLASLPFDEAMALRNSILTAAAGGTSTSVLALVPAVLLGKGAPPADTNSKPFDWSFGTQLLQVACKCTSSEGVGQNVELLALDALEALVVASPRDEVAALLKSIQETFKHVLKVGSGQSPPSARTARGAARCWAAAAVALLRRGGFASEAGGFLKDLLLALEQKDAPVAPFVPVAFQVMMPPNFGSTSSPASAAKLPSLAVQQLSHTVLPALFSSAKAAAASAEEGRGNSAALESAVTLLCALPVEVLCTDCTEELRWCALTGLKCLGADGTNAVFAAQVLQLLVRAAKRGSPWIEDDLQSVVPPLARLCSSHPVPLVRLGCLQVLQLVITSAQGHVLPFKKLIETATRKAVEDRRREVRLVAVACLNTWHCGLTAERD